MSEKWQRRESYFPQEGRCKIEEFSLVNIQILAARNELAIIEV
jgi:hypothetical protein